jgi:hypothetical protein
MTGDLIAGLAGLNGITLRVRHELHPASMRLMETLGVRVEITPDAPRCERIVLSYAGDHPGTRPCAECLRVERARAA